MYTWWSRLTERRLVHNQVKHTLCLLLAIKEAHKQDTFSRSLLCWYGAYYTTNCNGIALNIIERPGFTWAQVWGSYWYYQVLGRSILDGKPGVSGRGNEPQVQSPSCQERNKAVICLYATKQVSDNENVHHRQTKEGIPASHPA